jgi:hypothetical protein
MEGFVARATLAGVLRPVIVTRGIFYFRVSSIKKD